jgi:hypothetical protein
MPVFHSSSSVRLLNGQYINSSHTALLPFPKLPQKALEAHVFPGLNGQALLSIGTFCDAGCIATFTATEVIITLDGIVVLKGKREPPGLWKMDDTKTVSPTSTNPWQANGAYTTQLQSNAIKFMHAACFSPTTEAWTKAIDAGAFQSWAPHKQSCATTLTKVNGNSDGTPRSAAQERMQHQKTNNVANNNRANIETGNNLGGG